MSGLFVAFTKRERQILAHFVHGETETEVAHALGISAEIVGTHLQHIIDKLSLHLRLPTEG